MSKSIDINYCTARGLCKIPGVDPVLAKRIITYRRKLCGFDSIDQLMQVNGLPRGKYKKIADNAFVGKKQTPSKVGLHNSKPKQYSKNKTVEWNLEDNLIIPIGPRTPSPRPNRKSSRNSSKKVSITQPTNSIVQDVGTHYTNGTTQDATGTTKPNKQRWPNRLADETLQTPIMNFYISPGLSGQMPHPISGQPMTGQAQTGQPLPGNFPSGQQSSFLNTSTFPYSPTPLQFGNNPNDFKHVYSFDKEDYYTLQPSSTYDTENIKEHTIPKTPRTTQAQTERSREENFDFSNNRMFTNPLTSSTPKKLRKRQNKRRNQDISANSNDYPEYKDVQTNSDNNQNVSNDLQNITEADSKARGIYKENCNAIKQWLRGVAPYVFSDYETTATTDSEVDDLKQQEKVANSTSTRVKHRRKTRSKSKPSERHTTQCTCANERKEKQDMKQHKEKRNSEDEDNNNNQYDNSWPCVLM